MNKVIVSILIGLALIGSVQADVVTNAAPAPSVVIPVLTPVIGGTIGTTIGLLTNAPASVGANVVSDGIAWIIKHGAVSTGPGFTLDGHYGVLVGQDVVVYSVGVVGTNQFDIVVSHADFIAAKGGTIDEFGIGFEKTMPAPKWLSNFAIITSRPSTLKLGLGAYIPTTDIVNGKFNKNDVVIGPRVGWSF